MHPRGVPVAVIAQWLGHANPSIMASLYVHSQDDSLKATEMSFG